MVLEDAHALVIGIAHYLHEPHLKTTQDAQDVAAVLADAACCGYPPAQVQTLLDGAATREAILGALDALAHATREASTVFIYYSGHGCRARGANDGIYYILPVDAVGLTHDELERTGISSTELTARLKAIPAGRLTVVLDCCRAADMADAALGPAVAPLSHGRGRAVIAASRPTDSAFSLPGQRDSLMTGLLVEGLRGAAPGVAGVIRICDLFSYVQEHIAAGPIDQHPVFKAELEENYPIAQLRGGAAAPLVVPPPPDDAPYDAFVSYCHSDLGDRAWVMHTLVPYLEGLGLKLFLEHRDSDPGSPVVVQAEQAVLHSRYTVAVFTPAYLAGSIEGFQWLLGEFEAIESQSPCLIPLLRQPCRLAMHIRMTEILDATQDDEVPATLARLAVALRRVPRPRLAT